MNEQFLRNIYDSKNLGANGATFEDFLKDMQDPGFARKIFDSKELGAQGATFDDFITDSGLKPANPVQEHGGLYNLVGKIPVIGGAIQKGVDAISRGINQGASLSEGVNALTEGRGLDDEEVQAVSQILQKNKADAEGDNSITAKFMQQGAGSLSAGEWAGLAAETVVQSGAMMLRGAFDALTNAKSAAMLGTGTAAGAAAGTPLFGIGALAGGIAGTMGTVSGLTEAAGMYFQELQQELDARKLPINAESVRQVISDEAWLEQTRKRASVKGVVVGGVDAITGGLAAKIGGKIVPKLVKEGLEGRAARGLVAREVGKGLGVEIAGGAGGEGLSQVALGDDLDVKSIALEGIGEILPGGISIYSGYIGSEGGKQIAEAKRIRTEADKTGTPITSEVKTNSERTSGIGHLVDAYKSNDLESAKVALADLATVHTPEDFSGMIQTMAKVEGISAEDVQAITTKFEEAHAAAQKFNTPELRQDPERTSRAVKTRLDITQAEQAEAQLEEQKSAADPSLHPKYDSQIEEVRQVKAGLEETLTAVVAGKQLEVSDDPVFYKTRLEELETTKTTVRNESSAKTNELLEIGAVLQDNISSAISETYGSDETTTAPSQKVLYDGVEYEVTNTNKDGSYDLSTREGRFVKGAVPADTEWQGFVGEETNTTPVAKKEKKPSAVTRLEKALAGIKGSPIAQIEQIGALLNIGSIPDFVYAKLGDGDILAGKAVIQKAKDVHAEVKAFQTRLAGGKFFSDIDRQIAAARSRIETLDKQAIRQNPVTETTTSTPETPSIRQEPVMNDTSQPTSQVEPDTNTTNDTQNDAAVDGVNTSPANLAEETVIQEEEIKPEPLKTGEQINKEVMNTIRTEVLGVDPLSPTYLSVEDQIKDAVQNHISRENEAPFLRELQLAFDAMSGRPMDGSRQLAMGHAIYKLQEARKTVVNDIKKLQTGFWGNIGIGNKLETSKKVLSEIDDHLEILTRGMVRAGTTLGRALSVRKELLNFNRDTFSFMRQELQDNIRNGVVDQNDEVFLRDMEKKFETAKAEAEAISIKNAKARTNKAELIARNQFGQKRKRGKNLAHSLAALDKVIAGKLC